MTEPRLKLIAHIRDQIAQGPERYANTAKLQAVAGRMAELLNGEDKNAGPVREVPAVDKR